MVQLLIAILIGFVLLIFRKQIGVFTFECQAEMVRPMLSKKTYSVITGIIGGGWILIAALIIILKPTSDR